MSPLHYAVWNGQLECVKLLIANDRGVDCNGMRCSCINLQSTMGFSGDLFIHRLSHFYFNTLFSYFKALHLAVLDAPEKGLSDVLRHLLAVGANQNLQCNKGKTAFDIAMTNSNETALDIFAEFDSARDDHSLQSTYLSIVNDLRNKDKKVRYNYQEDAKIRQRLVEKWDAEFNLPEFLFERERIGFIPTGMKIHEHQIRPLAEGGFELQNISEYSNEYLLQEAFKNASIENKSSNNNVSSPIKSRVVEAIKSVEFAREQAMTNRERRMKLLQESAPDWSSPAVVEDALKLNKY